MRSGPGDVLAQERILARISAGDGSWKRVSSVGQVGTLSVRARFRASVSQGLSAKSWWKKSSAACVERAVGLNDIPGSSFLGMFI